MEVETDEAGPRSMAAWAWAAAWLVLGGLYVLTFLALLSIGILLLPVAVVLTVLLARRPEAQVGKPALVSGLGLPLLFVAWLNRDGPGTVCTTGHRSIRCTDEWSPWPFLAVGLGLVVLGLVLVARGAREGRS